MAERPGGDFRDLYEFCRMARGSGCLELATIGAGLVALRSYRFPFLVAPVAVALWALSMDVAPWILGDPSPAGRCAGWSRVWFGLGTLIVAWAVDLRARGDFAFWLHLFGRWRSGAA